MNKFEWPRIACVSRTLPGFQRSHSAFLYALLLVGSTCQLRAQTTQGLMAYEPFDASVGILLGATSGAGWAAPWDVQSNSNVTPGFNLANATPLQYPGLHTAGNYAVGGDQFYTAGRHFDTSATGSFRSFVAAGLIGKPGQTIWMSILMRKDGSSRDAFYTVLHGGNVDYWESIPGVEIGYFGTDSEANGVCYWGLRLDNKVYLSKVPILQGQPALLILQVQFGSVNSVSLYVNPSLEAQPANPDVQANTTNPLAFQSLAYASGWDPSETSIDEIRVAADYNSVVSATVVSPAAPTDVAVSSTSNQAALSWTPVAGADSYQVWGSSDSLNFQLLGTTNTSNYIDSTVVSGGAYSYYVTATNASGSSVPSAQTNAYPRPVVQPKASLGGNLVAISDWTREWPFVDIFKLARPWISQQSGMSWGQGGALNVTPDGWIASLQPGQYAETIILDNALDDASADFPSGNYTLFYDGSGAIEFDLNTATIVSQSPGQMIVNVPPNQIGIFLKITQIDPNNPLRNIRFIMPGFENTYQTQPFHPTFLSRLQGLKTVRFMEWEVTNNSPIQSWSDRPLPTDYTYSWRGVPLETIIQLANALQVDAWFNIPHAATDDYVRQFATLVSQQLNPNLKAYIEYSNETWNGQFSQNGYVQNMGLSLNLSSDPTAAGAYYTALRSMQIFKIWKDAYGEDASRFVRVLPSQAASAWMSQQIVTFQNAYGYADALAIAPYYSMCSDVSSGGFGFLGDPSTADQVTTMTVDQILDIELGHIRNCGLEEITSNAAVAQQYGLRLLAYEGGQSLIGVGSAQNNQQLISLFKSANRNSRIHDLYAEFLQNWKQSGGDLFMHYADVTPYTQYGNFGSLEYQDQDPSTAPKFRALSEFAADNK